MDFDSRVLPSTFEHTIAYLIDHEIDLCAFDARYESDEKCLVTSIEEWPHYAPRR